MNAGEIIFWLIIIGVCAILGWEGAQWLIDWIHAHVHIQYV